MPASLLIVDDEKNTREGLRAALEDDFEVYVAASAEEAFQLLESEKFDLVLTDLRMAGQSGMSVVDKAVAQPHHPAVLMMTAYGSVPVAVDAMRRGATDFLTKPIQIDQLEVKLKQALKNRRLETENKVLHQRLDQKFSEGGEIVGDSPALKAVQDQVRLVAASRATVLLLGETGSGKELFAQAVHQHSDRAREPFVAIHCEALHANLLESELFGHEKGAFTGATERRVGRFETADKGTLFLDEIGELSLSTQVKLLRFLETRTFERLGSSKPLKVDVRLVAATHRDLAQLVKEGAFREDLYYRLNVVQLRLPPLRERSSDIPLLLKHFTARFAAEYALPPVKFSAPTLTVLSNYRWPGNIRELRNFAENAVVMRRGQTLQPADLDPKFTAIEPARSPVGSENAPSLSVEDNEHRLLRDALRQTRGNRSDAAKLLGISRRTLHRKLHLWPDIDL